MTSSNPTHKARFGQRIATLNVFGAYSCRSVDNIAGARLSEHAFGNAVDVAGFTLADGREIDFLHDWKKTDSQESAFLHEAHAGACQYFTTVLAPGADVFHYNHIHLGSGQPRFDQDRPKAHLQADACARTSCRRPRRPTVCRPRRISTSPST